MTAAVPQLTIPQDQEFQSNPGSSSEYAGPPVLSSTTALAGIGWKSRAAHGVAPAVASEAAAGAEATEAASDPVTAAAAAAQESMQEPAATTAAPEAAVAVTFTGSSPATAALKQKNMQNFVAAAATAGGSVSTSAASGCELPANAHGTESSARDSAAPQDLAAAAAAAATNSTGSAAAAAAKRCSPTPGALAAAAATNRTGTAAGAAVYSELPPVDLVYLWVDGADAKFQRRVTTYTGKAPRCDRVASNNEILISLMAACKFLPLINRIHIGVDHQKFSLEFLEPSCQRRTSFVDLQEFVPAKYLPTFNSHVIEAHLHMIPGLTEHFIYSNDDMVFVRPQDLADKFSKINGQSLFLAEMAPVNSGALKYWRSHLGDPSKQWILPRYNGLKLFQQAFGKHRLPKGRDGHSVYYLTKGAMNATWTLFGNQLELTMGHKLRLYASLEEGGDVHITSLCQQVGVELGLMGLLVRDKVNFQSGSARFEDIVKGLFVTAVNGKVGGSADRSANKRPLADVVVLQELGWGLSDLGLKALCWLAKEQWCGEVPHCRVFLGMCSTRATCSDSQAVEKSSTKDRKRGNRGGNAVNKRLVRSLLSRWSP